MRVKQKAERPSREGVLFLGSAPQAVVSQGGRGLYGMWLDKLLLTVTLHGLEKDKRDQWPSSEK